jgi:hypothetical protein
VVGNRYAMTGNSYNGYYGDNREEMKVYSYTDRPVYRPGQKVYFRQILTQRDKSGDQIPAKNIKVTVSVTNPKGETFFTKSMVSSEFGTINGELTIPDGAPLGEYSCNANVPQTLQNVAASGGNRFRVEEYKRPEFQVSVDAPDKAVRPGATVAAKINAKYYFGSPVPNATVKYTVRRSVVVGQLSLPDRVRLALRLLGRRRLQHGTAQHRRRRFGRESSRKAPSKPTRKATLRWSSRRPKMWFPTMKTTGGVATTTRFIQLKPK